MSEEDINKKINEISEQIKKLQLEVEELKSNKTRPKKNDTEIVVGTKVAFTRKPGSQLVPTNPYNPKGTVVNITKSYVHIETSEGDCVRRAPKNVHRII